LADQLFYASVLLGSAGRLEEAAQTWDELTPLAERLGHTVWVGGDYDAPPWVRILRTGDIDTYAAFWQRWLERARAPGSLSVDLAKPGPPGCCLLLERALAGSARGFSSG